MGAENDGYVIRIRYMLGLALAALVLLPAEGSGQGAAKAKPLGRAHVPGELVVRFRADRVKAGEPAKGREGRVFLASTR